MNKNNLSKIVLKRAKWQSKRVKRTRGEIVEDLFKQLESKVKRQEEQVKWDRLILEKIKQEYRRTLK